MGVVMKRATWVFLALPLMSQAADLSGWASQIRNTLGAFRVAVKQVEVSMDKRMSVAMQSTAAAQSAALDMFNRRQVADTVGMFGPDGQLVDPCYQVGMSAVAANTASKAEGSASRQMDLIYRTSATGKANAGGLTGALGVTRDVSSYPYIANVSKRVERHRQRYCSVSESANGYCKLAPNGMQSADSDFSLHLSPGKTYGWDQAESANDFVKTVAPVRPVPQTKNCTSPECRAALRQRRVQESYMAMARYSMLRMVESRTSQKAGEAKEQK